MPPGPAHARQRRRRLLRLTGTLLGVVALSPRLHERLMPWVELERGADALASAAPAVPAAEPGPTIDALGAEQLFALMPPPAEGVGSAVGHALPDTAVHYVELNPALLSGKGAAFWQPGTRVRVPLPGGREITIEIEETDVAGADRFTSRGHVVGEPEARAVFAYYHGRLAARFENLPQGDFQLQPVTTPDGKMLNQLYTVDPASIPACGGEPEPVQPIGNDAGTLLVDAGGKGPGLLPGIGSDQGALPPGGAALIDVLFVYTPAVRDALGSEADVTARVDLGAAKVNADLVSSGSTARIRVAGVREVALPEDAENGPLPNYHADTLERLRQTRDGVLDEVHALRDAAGADLVCLLLRRPDAAGSSGTAYVLREPASYVGPFYGYSVVHYAYAGGEGSVLSHELGHNLGCAHARGDAGVTGARDGAYDFSYGHRFSAATAQGQTVELRTIMAYEPGSRLPYFSNPRLTVARARIGETMVDLPAEPALGVAEGGAGAADNARTIELTAFQVANYRISNDASSAGALINVSTRAHVGPEPLIGGFVVAGVGPQTVVVRAIGPALAAEPFRMAGVLDNPVLHVFQAGQSIGRNDDWWRDEMRLYQEGHAIEMASAMRQAGGFALPNGSRDAALRLSLTAGAYTAVVSSSDGAAGVALVEAYQQTSNGARLLNLSSRAHASSGRPVLAGFVVQPDPQRPAQRKRMLLRVLALSLGRHGLPVETLMPDPVLRLRDARGTLILHNDDWDSPTTDFDGATLDRTAPLVRGEVDQAAETQVEAASRAVGVPLLLPVEPAVVVELLPGAYTIEVRPFEELPANPAQPGVVLVEAYEVPSP